MKSSLNKNWWWLIIIVVIIAVNFLGSVFHERIDLTNENVHYKIISADDKMPGTERTYADTLSSLGIIPINLKIQLKAGEQSQYIYPAAIVTYKNKMQAVNLYS